MTDPIRSERPASSADLQERDRDARVEQLLLAGLDHYFAGHHERAISVWTRVLFLNHGHARARAYMERARSAIGERQRESEELLHTGVEAFARGEVADARRLLTLAVERGAATDEALALLDRLNRLDPSLPSPGSVALRPEPALLVSPYTPGTDLDPRPSRVRWVASGVATGALIAAAAGWLWFRGTDSWRAQGATPARTSLATDTEALPVPAASEAALARARALQTRGRLHESLAALDGVRAGDPLWPDAQALRAAIQRQLLVASAYRYPARTAPWALERANEVSQVPLYQLR